MCFRIFTDDFDYNLRFLILDAPGPAGMMKWAARRKRILISEYEYETHEETTV